MKKTLVMFMGERSDWRGKILQLFKDKNGKEYNFNGVKGVYFGEVYELNSDESIKRKPEPIQQNIWVPTEKERLQYEAAKIAVAQTRSDRRKELIIKKPHKDILRAVELIRPFYIHADNFDRSRLMKWFANACSKRKKK